MTTPHCFTRRSLPSTLFSSLLGAALASSTVLANGTRLPNQNAEATARGNAFVATADNPSAIYYNPAGLTQLPGLQVQAETYAIYSRNDYQATSASPTVEAERELAVIPQLYASFTPENSPLSYGLGVYAPFGQASEWPDDSGFRTIATRNEITFITVAPTVAWKISDRFSVGAGLQVNQVEADLRQGLTPFIPGPVQPEFRFKGDDTSLGYNLGFLWQVTEKHVFGLNYQSRSTSNFEGEAEISPLGLTSSASVDLPFPDVITFGYSWRPSAAWNLEIAIDRTNWDLLNTAELESAFGTLPITFDWKASYYYMFGVTRHLPHGWRVSAGYCFSENSVPDATFNPAVADMSRHLASVGAGRTFGAMSFFVAYQHGFRATRNVSGSTPSLLGESADGRYENSLDAISASFRYAF